MNKEESDLIIAEQNKSTEEILKAVAKVKADYHELCKLKDMRIEELEQENTELKTKKIPQLERRIASIRGSHSVDAKKLNARIEQVERLKKENAELKEKYAKNITDCDICDTYCNSQLIKAKELLKKVLGLKKVVTKAEEYLLLEEAEQFISEVEK